MRCCFCVAALGLVKRVSSAGFKSAGGFKMASGGGFTFGAGATTGAATGFTFGQPASVSAASTAPLGGSGFKVGEGFKVVEGPVKFGGFASSSSSSSSSACDPPASASSAVKPGGSAVGSVDVKASGSGGFPVTNAIKSGSTDDAPTTGGSLKSATATEKTDEVKPGGLLSPAAVLGTVVATKDGGAGGFKFGAPTAKADAGAVVASSGFQLTASTGAASGSVKPGGFQFGAAATTTTTTTETVVAKTDAAKPGFSFAGAATGGFQFSAGTKVASGGGAGGGVGGGAAGGSHAPSPFTFGQQNPVKSTAFGSNAAAPLGAPGGTTVNGGAEPAAAAFSGGTFSGALGVPATTTAVTTGAFSFTPKAAGSSQSGEGRATLQTQVSSVVMVVGFVNTVR